MVHLRFEHAIATRLRVNRITVRDGTWCWGVVLRIASSQRRVAHNTPCCERRCSCPRKRTSRIPTPRSDRANLATKMSATLASSCWHIANHTILALMMQIIIRNHTAARWAAVARMPQWTTVRRERDADSWLPRYYRNHHAGVSTHFGPGMFSSRVGWESVMRLYGMLRHKTWGTHQARPVSVRPAAAHGLERICASLRPNSSCNSPARQSKRQARSLGSSIPDFAAACVHAALLATPRGVD